ncbi:hypothetical protein AAFF_G00221240 [Aldrovandia affinis]|uniref:Uncharacterized protein n=1 Tax=Aldrovandia affinis TaxID=143900 RepID=A0AAD7RFU5_9TELE|nr:hypothetical protein AAFF_G00221240 [Aldrovandia affinis]
MLSCVEAGILPRRTINMKPCLSGAAPDACGEGDARSRATSPLPAPSRPPCGMCTVNVLRGSRTVCPVLAPCLPSDDIPSDVPRVPGPASRSFPAWECSRSGRRGIRARTAPFRRRGPLPELTLAPRRTTTMSCPFQIQNGGTDGSVVTSGRLRTRVAARSGGHVLHQLARAAALRHLPLAGGGTV